jgi:hypothetical protein
VGSVIMRDMDIREGQHFNVTDHPTAQRTGQQIIEAFPWAIG